MWAFDIANLKEAQTILRRRLNYDSIYRSDDAVPQTISEMLKASKEMRVHEEGNDKSDNEKSQ